MMGNIIRTPSKITAVVITITIIVTTTVVIGSQP